MKIIVNLTENELAEAVASWLDKQANTSQHAPWDISNIDISIQSSYEGYGFNERLVNKVKVTATSR